jgi:cobalt/nickel transport system permease protein
MAGNLFLRAFERSDRIYNAMLSRGYDGEIRSTPLPRLDSSQLAIMTAALVGLFLLLLLSFAL